MFTNGVKVTAKCINKKFIEKEIGTVLRSYSYKFGLFQQANVNFLKEVNPKRLDFLKCDCKRYLSTLNLNVAPQTEYMLSPHEINTFSSIFPMIINDLVETNKYVEAQEAKAHFKELLEYTVPHRKHEIGYSVVASYKALESPENLTPENIYLANILGWCSEMLASSFYINDDIVDASETRHGMPCWYRKKPNAFQAINDAQLLENGLYTVLRKYFANLPCYTPIYNLFHDVAINAAMGQSLDTMTMKDGKPALELFTMSRYNAIIKYKAGYMLFKLPVGLAMHLANISDPKLHEQANTILFKIGQFHQIHNDILNCFEDPSKTRTDGNDIQNGKCTWLIVEALHRTTTAQKEILQENYGKPDSKCENAVKALYKELGLLNSYEIYNKLVFELIQKDIKQLSNEKLRKLFNQFMDEQV